MLRSADDENTSTTLRHGRKRTLIAGRVLPPRGLEAGSQLGQYRLLRVLGRGGMGAVFLAEHATLRTRVAIKVLDGSLAAEPAAVERLMNEARVLQRVRHPNVVEIFGAGMAGPWAHYLVMEHLSGEPLSRARKTFQRPAQSVHVLLQLCDALEAIHARGVVHRDVKPSNVILVDRLDAPAFAKIFDFGIAKVLGDDDVVSETTAGTTLGTPSYMAPEQALCEPVDARADLYALGITAYELLTGRLPFASTAEKLRLPPRPPRDLNILVPEALSAVVLRTIRPSREERFASARALREALLGALGRRLTAELRAVQSASAEPSLFDVNGERLSRRADLRWVPGGVVVSNAESAPKLGSRVMLALPQYHTVLPARVVQCITPADAARWRTPPGLVLDFPDATPAVRKLIERLWRGER